MIPHLNSKVLKRSVFKEVERLLKRRAILQNRLSGF